MSQPRSPNPAAGAYNLLNNCVGARPGDRLLLVAEPPGLRHYDEQVVAAISAEAARMGVTARLLRAAPVAGPDDAPAAVLDAMREADHTVFCARLGDQIRFSEYGHDPGNVTMCYALDTDYLGSDFGRIPWRLYQQVHDRLLAAILAADSYRIQSPSGTDLSGKVPRRRGTNDKIDTDGLNPFTLKLFPVVIFPPLRCVELHGRLVLERFLSSTSLSRFDASVMPLEQPVAARIEHGRIVGFEVDDRGLADRLERHYRRVGALSDGDPFAVNSWHAGIYPKTFYGGDAYADLQRWGDIAFASPRYTHFHTCGAAPGNISIACFDATISFDGQPFWEAGRLVFLERPELQALLSDYQDTAEAFEMVWDIGL